LGRKIRPNLGLCVPVVGNCLVLPSEGRLDGPPEAAWRTATRGREGCPLNEESRNPGSAPCGEVTSLFPGCGSVSPGGPQDPLNRGCSRPTCGPWAVGVMRKLEGCQFQAGKNRDNKCQEGSENDLKSSAYTPYIYMYPSFILDFLARPSARASQTLCPALTQQFPRLRPPGQAPPSPPPLISLCLQR